MASVLDVQVKGDSERGGSLDGQDAIATEQWYQASPGGEKRILPQLVLHRVELDEMAPDGW